MNYKLFSVLFLMILCSTVLPDQHIAANFGLGFHESMEITPRYSRSAAEGKASFILAKNLYDTYIRNFEFHETPLIPTIDHHIWLGKKLDAGDRAMYQTWLTHHTDWHHIFWVDNPQNYDLGDVVARSMQEVTMYLAMPEYIGKTIVADVRGVPFECTYAIQQARNYGEKSDIMRYEFLYNFGGLYVDTDFECIRSFNVFNHSCNFYTGMDFPSHAFILFNGLIGSAAGHPIMRCCIDKIKQGVVGRTTLDRTGPYFFARTCLEVLMNRSVDTGISVLFPVTYFYPWPHYNRNENKPEQVRKWIKPETHGIHHWHVSWTPDGNAEKW